MKKKILPFFVWIFPTFFLAQNESNIWYFGDRAGIDFNSGSAVALTNGALTTFEGSASICDVNGNLLFYTDGDSVWNNTHAIMPNGFGLMGDETTSQSAIIVQRPGSNTIYYIFTLDDAGGPDGFRYSEVDMSLQGGLGDVTANKNVPIVDPTCEKISVIRHQNGVDYWVTVQLFDGTNTFHSYELTSAGLNMAPVVSNAGTAISNAVPDNSIGIMKSSVDGSLLAVSSWIPGFVEIFEFNNGTGTLSNPINLIGFNGVPFNGGPYGLEFSSCGDLLYVSENAWPTNSLFQYNLLAGSQAAINASRVDLGSVPSVTAGQLQMGPDGRIYHAVSGETTLSVVNSPGILGAACNYVINAFPIGGQTSQYGLPSFANAFLIQSGFTFDDLCFGDMTSFSSPNTASADSVRWNFGDPMSGANNTSIDTAATHVFSDTGYFNVSLTLYSGGISSSCSRTVYISETPDLDLGNDTLLCPNEILVLDATTTNATYLWHDNSNNATFTVNQQGTYWVEIDVGCTDSDTINVNYSIPPAFDLGNDTTLCDNETLTLSAALPGATYLWQDNSSNSTFTVTQAGTYWVQLTLNDCVSGDTIEVMYNSSSNIDLGNDTTVCEGELITLNATTANASYSWSNNSVDPTLDVTQQGTYWVQVTVNNCISSDTIDVDFNPLPNYSLGGDTVLCQGQTLILDATTPGGSYLWQDNSILSTFNVTEANTYWVEVTLNDCKKSDTIEVSYNPLPLVTLGEDTTICEGDVLTLYANAPDATSYLWFNNKASSSVNVNQDDSYWVQVMNGCGIDSDTIRVTLEDCDCRLYLADAFTPNGDNVNDVFSPATVCQFFEYNLSIFDRWGTKLYETNDPQGVWDGTYNNKVVPVGVYAYLVKFKFDDRESRRQEVRGKVTVVR